MTKDQQGLVRDLLDKEVGNLSDWAINFLESLEKNKWNFPLTEKQLNKVHELAMQEGLINEC